jgi:hypothetical protein
VLAPRRSLPALGDGRLRWLDVPSADPGATVAFERPDPAGGVAVVANTGATPLELPVTWGRDVLLASTAGADRDGGAGVRVPPGAAVWLRSRRSGRGARG